MSFFQISQEIFPLRMWEGHVLLKGLGIGPYNHGDPNVIIKILMGQL